MSVRLGSSKTRCAFDSGAICARSMIGCLSCDARLDGLVMR
jgi:hypothetical protein